MKPWSRRTFLGAGLSGAVATPAWAMSRQVYGHDLSMTLPIDPTDLDPTDPLSLTTRLLGDQLFEPLFRQTPTGIIYPTLADALPESGPSTSVRLRRGLRAESGSLITARTVVQSLLRAQQSCVPLQDLGRLRVRDADTFTCELKAPEQVARLLASPRAATCLVKAGAGAQPLAGPFTLTRRGATLELVRNPRAARGGSYLRSVRVHQATVREGLREFELGRSAVGFLGRGLYRSRGTQFTLSPLGWLVVQTGTGLGRYHSPGVMHAALRAIRSPGLQSLGVRTSSDRPPRSWRGPPMVLLVEAQSPLLGAIAEELAQVWSSPGHEVVVQRKSRATLNTLRRSKSFDAILSFIRADGPPGAALHDLYRLDGSIPPRGELNDSLEDEGRRLRTGVLGRLAPTGALAPELTGLVVPSGFLLADAQWREHRREA